MKKYYVEEKSQMKKKPQMKYTEKNPLREHHR